MKWGLHAVVNATRCCPESIRSARHIEAFSNHLVQKIRMVPYGKPQIIHFGTGNKAGYTLVQLIETSNIVAHFVEEYNDLYLDVFSCKEFNPDTVETIVQAFFHPLALSCQVLERGPPPVSLSDEPRRHGAETILR
jgi:S-adenosylmethionine/arginine decarboxylase-like enzyme